MEKRYENNVDPQELIGLFQQEDDLRKEYFAERDISLIPLKPIYAGNLYFTASMIYKLNPFFPMPCEIQGLQAGLFSNIHCRYYVSEETFNCINNYINNQKQESGGSAIVQLVGDNPIPYKKISFFSLLIHSIILITIIYLIISLISFARVVLSRQNIIIKILAGVLLIILPIFAALFFNFGYLLPLLPFIIVFLISSYIQNKKYNKIFLYVLAIILIILMISGIFVVNFMIDRTTLSSARDTSSLQIYQETEYQILQCENTKMISLEEKQAYFEEYMNEEWNVCDNPSCSEICRQACDFPKKIVMLRGDNPSCICGC